MMESEVMGNYHASFGERDGETRTVRIVKVRTVPTPLSPPTKLQTFFFGIVITWIWVDPKHDIDVILSHLHPLHQGAD